MVSWREVAFLILDNCSIEGKEEMTMLHKYLLITAVPHPSNKMATFGK